MNTNKLIDEVLMGGLTTDIEGLIRKETKSYRSHKVTEALGRRLSLSQFISICVYSCPFVVRLDWMISRFSS